MKVKLEVPQERYAELQAALVSHGIQVDEDADLILSERGRYPDTLLVREADTGRVLGRVDDILTLPANNVYVVRGGEREIMIPAVGQFIVRTAPQEGFLEVRLIEGL